MESSDLPGGAPPAVTQLPATPAAPVGTATAAFRRSWLVVGVVALVVYSGFPIWMWSAGWEEGDSITGYLWIGALWLVPAAIIVVGLVFGSRLFGRAAVLVGSALLGFNTLFYFAMLLLVLMVGCQVTLLAVGLLGVIAPRRSRWGFWRWTLVLLSPVFVGAAAQVLVSLLVWPKMAE